MTLFDGRTGEVIREDAPTKRPKRFRRTKTVQVFQNGTPPVGPDPIRRPAPSSAPVGNHPVRPLAPSPAVILGRLARAAAGDPTRFLRLLMRHLAREIGRRMG